MVAQHLKQIEKVKNLNTWVPRVVAQSLSYVWFFCDPMDCSTPGFPVLHHLLESLLKLISSESSNPLIICHPLLLLSSIFADWKSKNLFFWSVIFSYPMQKQWTISWSDCNMPLKVDFIRQLAMASSVVGPRRSSKALPKAKLAPPQKGHGHCLVVCCPSDPLQLSESWWSHYIWEVCSANRWDAPKTAMPAAGNGQQKGPDCSPQWHPTTCHTTNASKVEWIGLWSFASSTIFTWPLANWLPLLQASWELFAGKMLP